MQSRFQNGVPPNILRGITPTATLWDGTIGYAYMDDGGVFTDDTVDANDADANDVALMPAVPVLNDAFYFGEGFATSAAFNSLKINIGTAGVGGTIAWEYYTGAVWAALTVTDGTNGFTTAGTNYVTWTIPADMGHVAVNGQDRYWVRARVLTAFAPIPLATQIWIGKFPTNLSNTTDGSFTTVSGTATVSLSAGGNIGFIEYDLGTNRVYIVSARIGLWSSAGDILIYLDAFTSSGSSPLSVNSVYNITATTENTNSILTKIVYGRYLVFRFRLNAAGTANVKIYEVGAYEVGI